MRFSGIITPGDILIAISVLVSVLGAYNRLSIQIAEIKKDLANASEWYKNCIQGKCPLRDEVKDLSHLIFGKQGAD